MHIQLSDEEISKCKSFAQAVVSTNVDRYAERNQFDVDKIIDDIFVGKLAEYASYKLLLGRGKQVTEPDSQIYSARKKSFSADLTDGINHYHVKCMKKSTAERFGLSWSFQIEDKLVTKPADTDVMILCEIDGTDVDIKTIIRASKVTGLYTKPVLRKLWHIKRVLMWDDVYEQQNKR
jgi:hypothetical protein